MGDYVHGYDEREGARLADQAGALVDLLHGGTAYPEGSTVLEAGCGVGAQTITLATRSPGARITSVDISEESLAVARERVAEAGLDNVELVQADILDPPFAAASFDHLFLCFVLEHLPDPVAALARLATLVRPGGTVTVIEGDHGSAYFHPETAAAHAAVDCLVRLQATAGGDSLIGRRVYPLMAEAGVVDVRVQPLVVYADDSRPDLVEGFTRRTFTAMVEGVRDPAVAAGLIQADEFDAGVRDLHRTADGGGTFSYTFFKGTGTAA